jgi:hypothetical protein
MTFFPPAIWLSKIKSKHKFHERFSLSLIKNSPVADEVCDLHFLLSTRCADRNKIADRIPKFARHHIIIHLYPAQNLFISHVARNTFRVEHLPDGVVPVFQFIFGRSVNFPGFIVIQGHSLPIAEIFFVSPSD